jgi:hypothetical protein
LRKLMLIYSGARESERSTSSYPWRRRNEGSEE